MGKKFKSVLPAAMSAIRGIIMILVLKDCGYEVLTAKKVRGKEDELWIKIKLPKEVEK